MVQVLPERQTVGSAIAGALGNVGTAYMQRRQKDQLLQEYTDPNTPPARKAQIEMELPTQQLMALSKLRESQTKEQEKNQLNQIIEEVSKVYGGEQQQPTSGVASGVGSLMAPFLPGQEPKAATEGQSETTSGGKIPASTLMQLAGIKGAGGIVNQINKLEDRENKSRIAQEKLVQREKQENKKLSRQEKMLFHKDSEGLYNEILSDAKSAKQRKQISKDIAPLLDKADPSNFENIVANFAKDTPFAGMFYSTPSHVVASASVNFIEGAREMFGGVLTDAKLELISRKTISPENAPEVNKAILALRETMDEAKIARAEAADKIIKQNKGYRPKNFNALVNEEVEKILGPKKISKFEKIANKVASNGITEKNFVIIEDETGTQRQVPVEKMGNVLNKPGRKIVRS